MIIMELVFSLLGFVLFFMLKRYGLLLRILISGGLVWLLSSVMAILMQHTPH